MFLLVSSTNILPPPPISWLCKHYVTIPLTILLLYSNLHLLQFIIHLFYFTYIPTSSSPYIVSPNSTSHISIPLLTFLSKTLHTPISPTSSTFHCIFSVVMIITSISLSPSHLLFITTILSLSFLYLIFLIHSLHFFYSIIIYTILNSNYSLLIFHIINL
jgi:hypothetical protein